MPRIPRNLIIEEGFQAHKMWKSHNNEWNLNDNSEKAAYLNGMNIVIKKQKSINDLNAYSLMSNHSHELFDIINKNAFSNFMRDHHSRYGMYFNRKHQRKGKVAYDRPKTCLIENDEYSMYATFYIHANPVKAGITKNAANYKWSTHNLYAYGKKDQFTKFVKFPGWYLKLGKTNEQRQKKYRKLFDAYLRKSGLISFEFFNKPFFGNLLWMSDATLKISSWLKKNKSKDPPR